MITPDQPAFHLPTLDATIHATVFATKRAPYSPLRDVHVDAATEPRATWHIGVVHGALAIPDRTDRDEVVVTKEEIAASGLDYLALGHWHSTQKGKAGSTTYAYSGAPEPVAVDQDGAGKVLVVSLDDAAGGNSVTVEEAAVGRTTFERLDVDAARLNGQPDLIAQRPGEGQPRPRPRGPPDRRPPGRARRRPGRGRGAAQGLVPAAPRPRRSRCPP